MSRLFAEKVPGAGDFFCDTQRRSPFRLIKLTFRCVDTSGKKTSATTSSVHTSSLAATTSSEFHFVMNSHYEFYGVMNSHYEFYGVMNSHYKFYFARKRWGRPTAVRTWRKKPTAARTWPTAARRRWGKSQLQQEHGLLQQGHGER